MQNSFQLQSQLRVRENGIAHFSAVKPSLLIDEFLAKFISNLIQCGLPGLYDLMCDNVGVYDRYIAPCEKIRDGCFARSDATGEDDDEGAFLIQDSE